MKRREDIEDILQTMNMVTTDLFNAWTHETGTNSQEVGAILYDAIKVTDRLLNLLDKKDQNP